MRAPFDTKCDLKTGPGAAVPNHVYAIKVPCRLVLDNLGDEVGKFLGSQSHYLTIDAVQPSGALFTVAVGGYDVDCTAADRVAIPNGAAFAWGVLWTELVTPDVGTPYWRVHLTPIPDPDGRY